MAQTLPAIVKAFGTDNTLLAHFRGSLSPDDQQTLDGLLETAQAYQPVAAQTTPPSSMELLLLTLLLEQHKTVQFLLEQLNYYQQKLYFLKMHKSPLPQIIPGRPARN
jgi:hypothetical protein